MNITELVGKWHQHKGKLKQSLGLLTDNDRMYEKGKKEEMFALLQIKHGKIMATKAISGN